MGEEITYPKGSYVVLLKASGRNDEDMPEDYCYKLRANFHPGYFMPELDLKGSKTNGWSSYDVIRIRKATEREIEEYNKKKKPCDVLHLSSQITEDISMPEMEYSAGSYVVLLDGSNSTDSIPNNYCYKLRDYIKDRTFLIAKDKRGSTTNGWSSHNLNFKLRPATAKEIREYDLINGPFNVSVISKEEIIDNYSIY